MATAFWTLNVTQPHFRSHRHTWEINQNGDCVLNSQCNTASLSVSQIYLKINQYGDCVLNSQCHPTSLSVTQILNINQYGDCVLNSRCHTASLSVTDILENKPIWRLRSELSITMPNSLTLRKNTWKKPPNMATTFENLDIDLIMSHLKHWSRSLLSEEIIDFESHNYHREDKTRKTRWRLRLGPTWYWGHLPLERIYHSHLAGKSHCLLHQSSVLAPHGSSKTWLKFIIEKQSPRLVIIDVITPRLRRDNICVFFIKCLKTWSWISLNILWGLSA